MRRVFSAHPVEARLAVVLALMIIGLSLATNTFLTFGNLTSLLNNNAVNLIWAVGLLVVLIAGGIDISFAVAASVVQYLAAQVFMSIGGGNWAVGIVVAGTIGISLGLINALLIHGFRVISIVITIATFNAYFGLLMFFTKGRNIYNLPDWWVDRIFIFEHQAADGTWSELNLAVAVMIVCVLATWLLIGHTTLGRQLYAFGDNPGRRPPCRCQYSADAGIRVWLDGADGRHRRTDAGQYRPGGCPERSVRARTRRPCRGRSRRCSAGRRARGPSWDASSA